MKDIEILQFLTLSLELIKNNSIVQLEIIQEGFIA